jgi:competence protein ComEA
MNILLEDWLQIIVGPADSGKSPSPAGLDYFWRISTKLATITNKLFMNCVLPRRRSDPAKVVVAHRHQSPNLQPNRFVLRRAEQIAAACLLAVALSALGGHWLWNGRLRGRLLEIDRAEPVAVQFQIDINRADWPELALLPSVGEVLAKRIVDDRTDRGPFRELEELRRVRGIGPKTLEQMKLYLAPLSPLEATVGP